MGVTTIANKLVAHPPAGEIEEIDDDIDSRFKLFKNFEVAVTAPSDHHFLAAPVTDSLASFSCIKTFGRQPDRSAAVIARRMRIKAEWDVLKTRLPNSVFVRVYSTRPDLMRTAIVGINNGYSTADANEAARTRESPYKYGLFIFDIHFPAQYPMKPPLVHQHFHGVALEAPWFERNGPSRLTACLGDGSEAWWDPSRSGMVELLGFIQGSVVGRVEMKEERYNEVLVLSHRAMVSTLRDPPKGFEDLVKGYFRKFSHVILMQLKGILEGEGFGRNGGVGLGYTGKLTFELLVKVFKGNGSYCNHIVGGD